MKLITTTLVLMLLPLEMVTAAPTMHNHCLLAKKGDKDYDFCVGYLIGYNDASSTAGTFSANAGTDQLTFYSGVGGSLTSGLKVPDSFVAISLPSDWRERAEKGEADWGIVYDPSIVNASSSIVVSTPDTNGAKTGTVQAKGVPITEWKGVGASPPDLTGFQLWAKQTLPTNAAASILIPKSDGKLLMPGSDPGKKAQ